MSATRNAAAGNVIKIAPLIHQAETGDLATIDRVIADLDRLRDTARHGLTNIAEQRNRALLEDQDEHVAQFERDSDAHHLLLEKIDTAIPIVRERRLAAVSREQAEADAARRAALAAAFEKALADHPTWGPPAHYGDSEFAMVMLREQFEAAGQYIATLHPGPIEKQLSLGNWSDRYTAWAWRAAIHPRQINGHAFLLAASAAGIAIDFTDPNYPKFGLSEIPRPVIDVRGQQYVDAAPAPRCALPDGDI